MKLVPLRLRRTVAVPFRSGARLDQIPQVVAAHLEMRGFDVTEISEERVSFTGPSQNAFPAELWTSQRTISAGMIRFRTAERILTLECELHHGHFVLLVLGIVSLISAFSISAGEVALWVAIPGWIVFFLFLVWGHALSAGRHFARQLHAVVERQNFFGP